MRITDLHGFFLITTLLLLKGAWTVAQPDDEENSAETEVYLHFGVSNVGMRDRVISKFAYYGNGISGRLGVAHRNNFIQYGLSLGLQAPTVTTEMRKGFKYDADFIHDTVNGINGDDVHMKMVDVSGNLLFKLFRNTDRPLSFWLGARFDFISISKKFLTLDHQNLSTESYTMLSPMAQIEYQPHYRHRFTYALDASVFGFAQKEIQFNLKPDYSEKTDRYISLYKKGGGESFKNLLQVNSTIGYRFLIFNSLAVGAQYSFIYNRYSQPLEVRMVRQNVVLYVSVNF